MSALEDDSPAYCEAEDVQEAMQEIDTAFSEAPLGTANVEPAVVGASRWVRRRSGAHFYDSSAAASALISDSPATATDIQLSVPSSPHPQSGQLFKTGGAVHRQRSYPQTHVGQYCRVKSATGPPGLPHRYVETVDRLAVRGIGGETTDWVAGSQAQGRGEDYYLTVEGNDAYGRSHLYLHAGSLGPHFDFEHVAEADVTYGRDWQDTPWPGIRRGVAHLAAAELVVDDDILTQLPDNGTVPDVTTEAQQHLDAAMDRYLGDWLRVGVA